MPIYTASVTSGVETATVQVPIPPVTIEELLGQTPWYTAHRGSAGENPEHTAIAYNNAVAAGAASIEVSCVSSSDGTLFCFHDVGANSLDRVTNATGDASARTWADLSANVQVDIGSQLLGPGWPDQNLTLLTDVLDEHIGQRVIFLEPKNNAAVPLLQDLLLNNYPEAQNFVVWKVYYQSTSLTWAKTNGFFTWAYIDSGSPDVPATTMAEMDAVDANVDIWGVPTDRQTQTSGERIWAPNDDQITEVLNRPGDKPVMCWEVHRRSERDRLLALGVHGMMCSQFQYVTTNTPFYTEDDFSVQRKAPGNFGCIVRTKDDKLSIDYSMLWDTAVAPEVVYFDRISGTSMQLGAFCPLAGSYRIQFDWMYPVIPTALNEWAALYFGHANDDRYQASRADNAVSGYHLVIRPNATASNGAFQLYSHVAGTAAGTQLANTTMPLMSAGGWGTFQVDVTPTQIVCRRTDTDPVVQITSNSTAYRGGYIGWTTGVLTDRLTNPRLRNITVTAL